MRAKWVLLLLQNKKKNELIHLAKTNKKKNQKQTTEYIFVLQYIIIKDRSAFSNPREIWEERKKKKKTH